MGPRAVYPTPVQRLPSPDTDKETAPHEPPESLRQGTVQGARARGPADREAVRQGRDHEAGRRTGRRPHRGHLDRLHRARPRARRRRRARGARHRDLRPRVLRQDDARADHHRQRAEGRRQRRLHRRRARARRGLRAKARRGHRRPARLPARHRRGGARDRRPARALGRGRRHRHRLGGRARAQGRDRGRDGRLAHGPAGAAHVAGAAQAHRLDLQEQDDGHLHQPDPHADRRHVRQPRDDDRRPRAQVLRLGAHGHPAHRLAQGGRDGGRQPHARQGGQEQGRGAVPRGRVRHPLQRGDLARGRAHRHRHRPEPGARSSAPGSATATSASARAARTRASSSRSTPTCVPTSRASCAR